jgi:hypothetical protein
MHNTYTFRPLDHALATQYPSIHLPYGMADWPTKNVKVDKNSIRGRWGYNTADRTLDSAVQQVVLFQLKIGSRHTLYLTDTELCRKESDGTWSFLTEMGSYTGSNQVDAIADDVVTFEAGTTLETDGVEDGDYFVLDEDLTEAEEPDASWRVIEKVDSETQLTLTANYQKNVASPAGKNAYIRKVYSTPSSERWWYAIVDDKFCFGNGDTNVQYWGGANYASALDSTNAVNARYGIAYSTRLIIADEGIVRDPVMLKWSKKGDPTDWTDSSAGQKQFLETEDIITGLGTVGDTLVVYKKESIVFGNQTGESVAPIIFPDIKRGTGNIAPYSILHYLGKNAFLGRNNFYEIDTSLNIVPIGTQLKDKLFEIVGETEAENTWGFVNHEEHELVWLANTSEGQLAFTIDYHTGESSIYEYAHTIYGAGKGAV